MKNEITIPDHFPDLKEEGFIAATKRRDKYSQTRDIQALEFNGAIASRLLAMDKNQAKCEKCGKEFTAGITTEGTIVNCPECK